MVRLILGDDPQQAALAADIWRKSLAKGDIYLSQIVLIEVTWVLTASAIHR
jgi:predicted nucleic-acid-binding protein